MWRRLQAIGSSRQGRWSKRRPRGASAISRKKATTKRLGGRLLEPLEDRVVPAGVILVDSLDDVIDFDDNQTTLREAIFAANIVSGHDTIRFQLPQPPGLLSIALSAQLPAIQDDLTIEGPGRDRLQIAGNQADRIFEISAGKTVSILDLALTEGGTITGLNPGVEGGAIFNAGTLTLNRIHGHNNMADSGGFLFLDNDVPAARATVLNSVIEENDAGTFGGALRTSEGHELTLRNTIIDNNEAANGGGLASGIATVLIADSRFRGNVSAGGGGAIRSFGATTLLRSSFDGNAAINESGGAIFVGANTLTVINTTMSANESNFSGGAIATMDNVTINITNSTIANNYADLDNNGGGLERGGGLALGANDVVRLVNTIVAGNTTEARVTPSDIEGDVVKAESFFNLIGDAASAGGLMNGVNGNRVGVDPKLEPLTSASQGVTYLHPLGLDSPALDAGSNIRAVDAAGIPLGVDQGGGARILDGNNNGVAVVDIGAAERLKRAPDAHLVGRIRENGQWWMAQSDGVSFFNRQMDVWSTSANWVDVSQGDFNGDGLDDVVGRNQATGEWWVGLSDGVQFISRPWTRWSSAVAWADVQVADVDGDGKSDLVGRRQSNGDWWVSKSTGTGFVNQLWGAWGASIMWVDVQTADVDGDGRADLIGRNKATGAWWVGKSTGVRFVNQAWGAWGRAVTWVDVQTADVDGDGLVDLVGRDQSNGAWWVSRSTGTRFVNQFWGMWGRTATWVDVHVADVNGDGKADLVGRDQTTGAWWVGRSTGSSFVNEFWVGWSRAVTWLDVRIADVNGDGKADLVGRRQSNGDLWVALSTGTTFVNVLWGRWGMPGTFVDVHSGGFTELVS